MAKKISVAHIGNTANIAYYFSHLIKQYSIESTVFQPKSPTAIMSKIFYGYESGNPLNVNLKFYEQKNRIAQFRKIANEYDIVELHEGGGFRSVTTRLTSSKRIAHFHGSELRGKRLSKRLLRLVFRLSGFDQILLSTPDLKEFVWDKKAEVLLNPIDPVISRTNAASGRFIFLPTRLDDSVKGSQLAFEAWSNIREKLNDLKLVVIRWGSDAQKYENLTKGDDCIVWLDPLNRPEYIKTLSSADLVFGQFKFDILSLVELEAIGAEKPVISVNTSKVSSPEDIANESIRLLVDDNYKQKVKTSQQSLLAPYNPKQLSRQLYETYIRVLEI